MKNDPKRVFIPFHKWNQLQNETRSTETDKRAFTIPGFDHHPRTISRERSKSIDAPSTIDIRDAVEKSNLVLQKKKILPVELRRAMFLSNVFTEKANQLEFMRIVGQLEEEKENCEKEEVRKEENSYQTLKQSNRKDAAQKKLLLKRSLLDELQKKRAYKKESHQAEIENEREELLRIVNKVYKKEEEDKKQEFLKKKELKKMFSEDLTAKQEYRKCHFDESRYENKCILSPKNRMLKKDFLNVFKEQQDKRKISPLAIISEPTTKKSFLEIKRELYEKKLKEERIRMYEKQMNELMERKNRENWAKRIEYEQRLQNLDVTDKLQQRKRRENCKKIMENRSIWSKQCAERKSKFEKERLEDRERLLKLQRDMKKEDEEFLGDMNGILNEFQKQGKNILPIIKCIKEFEKSKIPQLKQLPHQLCTSFAKTSD